MSGSGKLHPNMSVIAMGLLFLAVGMIPVLAVTGILPHGNAPSDPAPSWIGWLIGFMFGGGGVLIIIKGVVGGDMQNAALPDDAPLFLRAIHDLLTVAIICSIPLLFTWVGFGPGTRHFNVSGGGLMMRTSGSGDMLGRIAFGGAAILFWIGAFFAVRSIVRRWRG